MTPDIFIQIAAYRDPELPVTLADAVAHATRPDRLHFCIAWQHGPDERYEDIFGGLPEGPRLTVLDIPHEESKGVCWARNRIQQEYDGETYTMQLDSHHRFVQGWDDICVDMLEGLRSEGIAKPLLTTYLPSYDPANDPEGRVQEAWELILDRFIPEGAIFTSPRTMAGWEERSRPMRGRFYSAHFAFTVGAFAQEVQHDPELYFHGEEISIAVRAFTHGYDLFYPHRLIAWHEYTRRGRTKHWDDHHDWGEVNRSSHSLNRKLFGMDEYADRPEEVTQVQAGPFGFGSERTLRDYEQFAGICFRHRSVAPAVLESREPPAEPPDTSYEEFLATCRPRFKHCIDIGYESVPLDDYDWWMVGIMDEGGQELFSRRVERDEIDRMKEDPDHYCKLWVEFDTEERPRRWVVWPHREQGWTPPVVGWIG